MWTQVSATWSAYDVVCSTYEWMWINSRIWANLEWYWNDHEPKRSFVCKKSRIWLCLYSNEKLKLVGKCANKLTTLWTSRVVQQCSCCTNSGLILFSVVNCASQNWWKFDVMHFFPVFFLFYLFFPWHSLASLVFVLLTIPSDVCLLFFLFSIHFATNIYYDIDAVIFGTMM